MLNSKYISDYATWYKALFNHNTDKFGSIVRYKVIINLITTTHKSGITARYKAIVKRSTQIVAFHYRDPLLQATKN